MTVKGLESKEDIPLHGDASINQDEDREVCDSNAIDCALVGVGELRSLKYADAYLDVMAENDARYNKWTGEKMAAWALCRRGHLFPEYVNRRNPEYQN